MPLAGCAIEGLVPLRLELYGDDLCRVGAAVRQFDRIAGEDFYFLHAEFDVLGRHAFPFPLEL